MVTEVDLMKFDIKFKTLTMASNGLRAGGA